MTRLKSLFAFGLPLLAVAAATTWLIAPDRLIPRGGSASGMTFKTASIDRGPIRRIVATSGPVRALVTVSIGSQLSGQVQQLNVDFNSEVKEGDLLALIDPRTFAAQVAQAKADLEAAQAALANQKAVRLKAVAVKDLAERDLSRQQSLEKKGYASTSALDNARRDSAVASAEIVVADAQIKSAEAAVVQREAALRQAEVDLERTRIVSPINGTVIERTVDLGQTVAASFQAPELFKIAQDLRRIRIEAQVNEADVGAVAVGNPVVFSVDAYPDRTFNGKVTQIRLAATELQNVVTYTVIIEASNEDRHLFPGMTANALIEVAATGDALRVPNDALRFRPRGAVEELVVAADRPSGESRGQRHLERLRLQLGLDDQQAAAVAAAMREARGGGQAGFGSIDPQVANRDAMRQRIRQATEAVLARVIREDQRPAFELWKQGATTARSGTLYVPVTGGRLERRYVRLGIADDGFTEILSKAFKPGDMVVVRAREAGR